MPIRGVLLDLDNTLIDFMGMKRAASDAAARSMVAGGADFPFSAEEAGDILFGRYRDDIEGDTVFEDFLKEHHRQKLRLDQHAVAASRRRRSMRTWMPNSTTCAPIPGSGAPSSNLYAAACVWASSRTLRGSRRTSDWTGQA